MNQLPQLKNQILLNPKDCFSHFQHPLCLLQAGRRVRRGDADRRQIGKRCHLGLRHGDLQVAVPGPHIAAPLGLLDARPRHPPGGQPPVPDGPGWGPAAALHVCLAQAAEGPWAWMIQKLSS